MKLVLTKEKLLALQKAKQLPQKQKALDRYLTFLSFRGKKHGR